MLTCGNPYFAGMAFVPATKEFSEVFLSLCSLKGFSRETEVNILTSYFPCLNSENMIEKLYILEVSSTSLLTNSNTILKGSQLHFNGVLYAYSMATQNLFLCVLLAIFKIMLELKQWTNRNQEFSL
jgi:phosphatidylserine synthase